MDCSHNKISTVNITTFQLLPHFVELNLSHNNLNSVSNLPEAKLHVLDLSYNNLTTISMKWFKLLKKNENSNFILSGNNFQCDSGLMGLFESFICDQVSESQLYSNIDLTRRKIQSSSSILIHKTSGSLSTPGVCRMKPNLFARSRTGCININNTCEISSCNLQSLLDFARENKQNNCSYWYA